MTQSVVQNPFFDHRVETAVGPLLLSRHQGVVALEQPKNYLLVGSRGSGKTSALLCLDWKERSQNVSLKKDIGTESIGFVAIYAKLHAHVSSAIRTIPWEKLLDQEAAATTGFEFFSTLVELLSASKIADATMQMRGSGLLSYDFTLEKKISSRLYEIADECGFRNLPDTFTDLSDFRNWCTRFSNELNRLGTRRELATALDLLPSSRPCRFVAQIAKTVRELVIGTTTSNQIDPSFHFKICFDEAETLSRSQQIYLNSLVRNSEAPLFWVVATVDRLYETTETMELGQSLSASDRTVLYLDQDRQGEEFTAFAQSVALMRLKNSLGCFTTAENTQFDDLTFDLKRLLGKYFVNDAIELMLSGGHSQFSVNLRDCEEEFSKYLASVENNAPSARKLKKPQLKRFYEAYLVDKLFGQKALSEVVPRKALERKNFLAGLRRKQIGALLCILKEGRFRRIPYFGAGPLLSLADGNIREFLEIMAEVFAVAEEKFGDDTIKVFAGIDTKSKIGIGHQRQAFEGAAAKKLNGIANRHVEIGGSVSSLVNCLGNLTHLLQTDLRNLRAIRTPEPGNFEIRLEDMTQTAKHSKKELLLLTKEVIDRCIEDVFLKEATLGRSVTTHEGIPRGTYLVRVHQRFSPVFMTSIRGAYSTIKISPNAIVDALLNPAIDPKAWAEQMFQHLRDQVITFGQIELPLGNGVEEDADEHNWLY
jgi:hypothetical protein